VELELHLGGVGRDGEGELLRRALPLLRLLVLDAALEVLLALLRQHGDGRREQAQGQHEGRERARRDGMLHLEPHKAVSFQQSAVSFERRRAGQPTVRVYTSGQERRS
jgi:hypothetical protein